MTYLVKDHGGGDLAQQGQGDGAVQFTPAAGAVGEVAGIEGGGVEGDIAVETQQGTAQLGHHTKQIANARGLAAGGIARRLARQHVAGGAAIEGPLRHELGLKFQRGASS